jgi:hypothetical protein
MSSNQYFASKDAKATASALMHKANAWYNQLYMNGYLNKVRDMWLAYHGIFQSSGAGSHHITFGGEQGELVNLHVNHMRNIATHMQRMITSNRPAFQTRATNTDVKSQAQTKLANNLLDYYLRDKRLEKYLSRAVEYAIVLGSGFVKMDWNATGGEAYDYNEQTKTYIYEGDVEFCNLSPYDVVFDTTKETSDQNDWVICRSFKNKFDVAAKFPEFENKIKGLSTKSDMLRFKFDMMAYDETDDIPIYEFYHKRTESMPDGRYLLFLDENIILLDLPIPYRNLPIYRISPGDILGTPYGYTPLFDLLPIQEAVNSLYSTILTNQHAFGVQNIYVPRNSNISTKQLEGGLNIIEGDIRDGKPEPLNLTSTPPEIFNFLRMLENQMELISGINSVSRGNPEASLKSGTALALVQSMSLQFISGLQQQYVQLIEDVGIGLINMLKDYASVPRIGMIAGKSNRTYVEQQFQGSDLSEINRVIVDIGNPVSRTAAGKLQIASDLIQYSKNITPEQYINVMTTGQLDTLTDDVENELILIKDENERMMEGEQVPVLAIDQHLNHIKGHRALFSDVSMRSNESLNGNILDHINDHINALRTTDPALLAILGEQPLGPAAGTPPSNPQQVNQGSAPDMAALGPVPSAAEAPGMPEMPTVDASLLPNPELQQQAMGNVK